jgi:hypothetical protein
MRRGSIFAGLILILVGLFFLLLPLFPNLSANFNIEEQWPLIIVAIGGLFLLGALIGAPGLAIPGSIISGLGLMMYYQNANDAWETWAYSWTLITGFVGVGLIISQALEGNWRNGLKDGGRLIIISLAMFFIFGSFVGGFGSINIILAIGLIAVGIWLLSKNLFFREKSDKPEEKKEDQIMDDPVKKG